MTRPAVATVILSAGESSRFGHQPKALLSVGPELAVQRIVRVSHEFGTDPVVVVTGPHDAPIRHALRDHTAQIVNNQDWEVGRTGSIQCGLNAVPEDRDILLWPVDHPFPRVETIASLLRCLEDDEVAWWFIPEHSNQGGHPVLLRQPIRARVNELRADAPLRALLPEIPLFVRRIPVADPGVIASVDTPEGYAEAYDAWRQREGAP